MKRKIIRLTESQLNRVIKESVKRVLRESKGKQKLQNSFKSKEDMTQYRDIYAPGRMTTYVDYNGSPYDYDYNDGPGSWGAGPYQSPSYHMFDDGYDYCGDDEKNMEIDRYNHALYNRLATKGGQMSYDWDDMKRQHEDEIKNQQDKLNYLKSEYDRIYQGKGGNTQYWKKEWLRHNPMVNDEFLEKFSGNPKQQEKDVISDLENSY